MKKKQQFFDTQINFFSLLSCGRQIPRRAHTYEVTAITTEP